MSEVFNVTLRHVYYLLIETTAVVSDLLRKYKTEWWQRKSEIAKTEKTTVG